MSMHKMTALRQFTCFGSAFLMVLACMTNAAEQKMPKTGLMRSARFTKRSPLSNPRAVARQFDGCGYPIDTKDDYNLEAESFVVYVPANYDPSVPYGLIVWIHAGNDGGNPPRPLLDKHRLLWVGANRSGNKRAVGQRFGLALDGLENMKTQYNVDDDRIYVSGFSGGGRCASLMAAWNAELFKGGIYICGCNAPAANVHRAEKAGNRYVFLTGTKDMNLQGTQRVLAAYEQAGFKRLTYLEVPGMGHAVPSSEWWEKAIEALDAPFAEKAKALYSAAVAEDKKGRLGAAVNGYARAVLYGGGHDFVKQAEKRKKELVQKYNSGLAAAEADFKSEKYALAEANAKRLVKEYGRDYSTQASRLLARLSTPEIKAKMRAQQLTARNEMIESEGKSRLAAAEQMLKTDLYKGFFDLKSIAQNYAGTEAGKEAAARTAGILADPEKKKALKARHDILQAEALMDEARDYARKQAFIRCRAKLEEIIRRFPRTTVADEAKDALAKIKNK